MRLNRYNFLKCTTALLLFLYLNFQRFLYNTGNYESFLFSDVFFMRVYGNGIASRDRARTMVLISGLLFIVVCNFLFSNYFYKDLHISSVYIFVRNKNRMNWLFWRSMELLVYIGIYVLFYVGAAFLGAIELSNKTPQGEDFIFVVTVFLAAFFYCYVSTFLINVLSIKFGSGYAFFVVMILQAVLTELAVKHEKIPFLKSHSMLLRINPVANIICTWKVSGLVEMSLYYLILGALLFIGCCAYITRIDIALENKE